MKKSILLLLCMAQGLIQAQTDRHFSMFYEDVASLNPASVGVIDEDLRILTNYRRQWTNLGIDPYRSFQISIDGNALKESKKISYLGYGVNILSDVLPNGMKSNSIKIALGSGVQLGRNTSLSAGFSLGYNQAFSGFSNLLFSEQWNGAQLSGSLPSQEALRTNRVKYADIGLGLYMRTQLNEHKLYAGISAQHINKPKVGFLSPNEALYRALILSLGGEFSLGDSKLSVEPHALVLAQGPNTVFTGGGIGRYYLSRASKHLDFVVNSSVYAGLFVRSNDGLILNLGYTYDTFSLGASFDVSAFSLRKANTVEIMLRYSIKTR